MSRGQRFSTVLVVERAAGESIPANARALSATDGPSTSSVDSRAFWALEIPAPLVPRLLSNAAASPSHLPSPTPRPKLRTRGVDFRRLASRPWRMPSKVVAHAVRHLVGKGGTTARLIEDISGVIVGVADQRDEEAFVMLFGPKRRVDAARAIVEAMVNGA